MSAKTGFRNNEYFATIRLNAAESRVSISQNIRFEKARRPGNGTEEPPSRGRGADATAREVEPDGRADKHPPDLTRQGEGARPDERSKRGWAYQRAGHDSGPGPLGRGAPRLGAAQAVAAHLAFGKHEPPTRPGAPARGKKEGPAPAAADAAR